MLKRKLSTLILAATIANLVATPANVFAETAVKNSAAQSNEVEESKLNNKATITKFNLHGSELLESYNMIYK